MRGERFTVTIDAKLKRHLEEQAKLNFRTLGGEINYALNYYINHKEAAKVQQLNDPLPSAINNNEVVKHEQIEVYRESVPQSTSYDEIEEF